MRNIYLTIVTLLLTLGASAQGTPTWLEPTDSAAAIHQRLLADFPYTMDEALIMLRERHPEVTADSIPGFIANHYIETMTLDGDERMFRKSPRNLGLLHPWRNGGWTQRGWNASPARIAIADSAVNGRTPSSHAVRTRYTYTIEVPYHPSLAGDTLSAWLPYPITSERQSPAKLISATPGGYVIANPDSATHCTIHFRQPVVEGRPTVFSYEAEFVSGDRYYPPRLIMERIQPYDRESDTYRRFTAMEAPHIIRLDSLARAIVGDETNPYRQSEMVYDYIVSHYPWAGAREYSTIPCIPRYVVERGYGDCGQVTLLYISLMRTLGVPARWESGYMIHPGEVGMHDWAEVYFEGVGWVPVDVSFGRYLTAEDPAIVNFYSTGIDRYRMATNRGVCGEFTPAKRYLRSETVDSQAGEVESTRGNIFYDGWKRKLQIIECEPVDRP